MTLSVHFTVQSIMETATAMLAGEGGSATFLAAQETLLIVLDMATATLKHILAPVIVAGQERKTPRDT